MPGAFPCPVAVYLAPDVAREACPLFVGRLIRGVRNGPSPQWLQDRLRAIGLRPISALVDITNFITYDRDRPLHVFDADKLTGPITVRARRGPARRSRALDGKDYALRRLRDAWSATPAARESSAASWAACAPAAPRRPPTSSSRRPTSTRSAPPAPAARLGINSDARYRFERGVDPAFTPPGIELATRHDPRALRRRGLRGRDRRRGAGAPPAATASTRRGWRRLVGMDIPEAEQVRILTALGFSRRRRRAPSPPTLAAATCRARPISSRRSPASPRCRQLEGQPLSRPAGRGPADPDADAAPRGPGPAADRRARLQRVRHLQLHRPRPRPSSSAAAARRCGWRTRSARR